MTHWKKNTNPQYLGAYALDKNQDMILTIREVRKESVIGENSRKEECNVVYFMENVKPMVLNATNCKAITKLYHTPYVEEWKGKKVQIYAASVKAFGTTTDALRIRPFVKEPESARHVCTVCKKAVQPYGGKSADYIADYTVKKFGGVLCAACFHTKLEEAKNEA